MAAAAIALSTGTAHAANQGTLGATSTGDITITASVQARVRITGLADVSWTNQDPGTAATNAQDVCVWSNTSTKGYTVTASGDGASNAFTLANGALTVPYSVQWNASAPNVELLYPTTVLPSAETPFARLKKTPPDRSPKPTIGPPPTVQ